MDAMLYWGLALMGIALLITIVEIFVPTGGVLAAVSAILAISGVVCLFRYDLTWGLIGLGVVMFGGPAIMYGGLNVWSNTAMGRKALGTPTEEEEQAQRLAEERAQDERMKLLNATGVTLTELRPVGMVNIAGQRHSALAEAGFIRAGAPIRVTVVESHAIRVREEPPSA